MCVRVQVRVATATKKRLVVCSVRQVPRSVAEAQSTRSGVTIIEFARMEKMAVYRN
jgi:hypothetical protein